MKDLLNRITYKPVEFVVSILIALILIIILGYVYPADAQYIHRVPSGDHCFETNAGTVCD